MPRPRKWRRVCGLPGYARFGPLGGRRVAESAESSSTPPTVPQPAHMTVVMTVEEYEAVRLIDLEGFTQEECAKQMGIARTTVQGMYDSARKKIADSLVNGKAMVIEGGDYVLCDGLEETCQCGGCARHRRGRRGRE